MKDILTFPRSMTFYKKKPNATQSSPGPATHSTFLPNASRHAIESPHFLNSTTKSSATPPCPYMSDNPVHWSTGHQSISAVEAR